jgi:uncharacterized protein (UPF0179 family)
MPLVTLIGEKLAEKGKEFVYIGPNKECKNCKLKTVCFNLKPGKKYKITNIRDKKHNCNIHEGTASVIEVQEQPIITCIDKKYDENSNSKIEKNNCGSIGCMYHDLCSVNIEKGKKYKIIKIFEEIECPIGYKIQKVELKEK